MTLNMQVLSNSVAEALSLMKQPQLDKTTEFCRIFNNFFDCLNVSNLEEGKRSRNPFKVPYHSSQDFRLKVIASL